MNRMLIKQIKRPPDKDLRLLEAHNYLKLFQRSYTIANDTTKEKTQKFITNSEVMNAHKNVDRPSVPASALYKTDKPGFLHLLNQNAADKFASMIIEDGMKMDSLILEINPGLGLLTRHLLRAGCNRIHLFERSPDFLQHLTSLVDQFPTKLEIREYNFLNLSTIEYLDEKLNKNTMDVIMHGVEKRKWEDEPSICIIGAVPSIKFFQYIQLSMISKYLANYGRIVFYVAILPSMSLVWEDMKEIKLFHRPKNIVLQNLFIYKRLGTLPRNVFYPLRSGKVIRKRDGKYFTEDKELMHIIKLEANPEFITDDFTRHDAMLFLNFLTIHMRRTDMTIIPALEKWIPGCGPRLIKQNFTIFTRFSELSASELLNLFKTFKSWPEFESSAFVSFVASTARRKLFQSDEN